MSQRAILRVSELMAVHKRTLHLVGPDCATLVSLIKLVTSMSLFPFSMSLPLPQGLGQRSGVPLWAGLWVLRAHVLFERAQARRGARPGKGVTGQQGRLHFLCCWPGWALLLRNSWELPLRQPGKAPQRGSLAVSSPLTTPQPPACTFPQSQNLGTPTSRAPLVEPRRRPEHPSDSCRSP